MYFLQWWNWKFLLLIQIWTWRSRSVGPINNMILNKVFCTSGPKLEILAWSDEELWYGQGQNGKSLYFQVKFAHEGHGWSLHKIKGTLTKVHCIFGPNLVILGWTGSQLWCRQASDYNTHGHTGRQMQATIKPEGQVCPQVNNGTNQSIQYIPRNMHTVLLCFALLWLCNRS